MKHLLIYGHRDFEAIHMLANILDSRGPLGTFGRDVHLPTTSLYELLDFIACELPRWRDRGDRASETSETALTSQLCAHLNGAARHAGAWDFLQFRIEEPDQTNKSRRIDLVPAPCGVTVVIEGRRHTDFDQLLPIECKRLPTPKRADRDEREYVISRVSSTGGIERFKSGHHGATHSLGAMIAYVQGGTTFFWQKQVAEWIKELVANGQGGWTPADQLRIHHEDHMQGVTVLRSFHSRLNGMRDLELRHLWLRMS